MIDLLIKTNRCKISNSEQIDTFKELFSTEENNIIVLLGSIGSGKSSILRNYNEEYPTETSMKNVYAFLKSDRGDLEDIVLIDGLDEYRSTLNSKTSIMTDIAFKIKEIDKTKVVISCRTLDWFNDLDESSIKDVVPGDVSIYNIMDIQESQQNEFADYFAIDDNATFIDRFAKLGFLQTPQLFSMIADVYNKVDTNDINIDSKKELYIQYIKFAKEHNPGYTNNDVMTLSQNDRLSYAGYLALYYIFSGRNKIDDSLIDEVATSANNFDIKNIKYIKKTILFKTDGSFIHRSIAEFLAAYYLVELTTYKNFKEFINDYFVYNNRVASELRGTFSWICTLTQDISLIELDPYYQCIYGDNSLLDLDMKKSTINAIGTYSENNPYFINHGFDFKELRLYDKQLESFIIGKINTIMHYASQMSRRNDVNNMSFINHFFSFLICIIQKEYLTDRLSTFLKGLIYIDYLHDYIKKEIIDILEDDKEFLFNAISKIYEKNIIDSSGNIQLHILRKLYINTISSSDITNHIIKIKVRSIGSIDFIYNTPYEEKHHLAIKLLEVIEVFRKKQERNIDIQIFNTRDQIENFIGDYLVESLLLYIQNPDINKLYKIIENTNVNKYAHSPLEYSNHYVNKNTKNAKNRIENYIEEITDGLFSLYILKCIDLKETCNFITGDFRTFFNYDGIILKRVILFSYMNLANDLELNKNLFSEALYLERDKDNKIVVDNEVEKICKEFKLEEVLYSVVNPVKKQWEIDAEERKEKKREKFIDDTVRNEEYYNGLSDEELEINLGALYILIEYYMRNKFNEDNFRKLPLKENTIIRIKKAIASLINNEKKINPEELNLYSLYKNPRYKIHSAYYTSITLQENLLIDEYEPLYKEYLYMNSINSYFANKFTSFSSSFESHDIDFCRRTLRKYIKLQLVYSKLTYTGIFLKYINKEDDISDLKEICYQYTEYEKYFFRNFLKKYLLSIEMKDLKNLNKIDALHEESRDQLNVWIDFKKNNIRKLCTQKKASILVDLCHLRDNALYFNDTEQTIKIGFILMKSFNTEESIKFENHSDSASFIRSDFFKSKDIEMYKKLLKKINSNNLYIWQDRIKNTISELEQDMSDNKFKHLSIKDTKELIFKDTTVNGLIQFAPNYYGVGLNRTPNKRDFKNTVRRVKGWFS